MTIALQVLVLLLGTVFFAVLYENVAGNESFSLPFSDFLLVPIMGAVLSAWWGWPAVLAVLGAYGAKCVVGGFIERIQFRNSSKLE